MSYREHGHFQKTEKTKCDDRYVFSVLVQVAHLRPSDHGDLPPMLDDLQPDSSDWCLGVLIFQRKISTSQDRTHPQLENSSSRELRVFQGCDHIGSCTAGASVAKHLGKVDGVRSAVGSCLFHQALLCDALAAGFNSGEYHWFAALASPMSRFPS